MADNIVQGGMFGGLDWQPLGNDAPLGSTPAAPAFSLPSPVELPSVGGSATSSSGNSIAGAAANAGISGGTITPTGTTGNAAGATAAPGSAQNWFARGTVVILGFVFVAVGLSQFGVMRRV